MNYWRIGVVAVTLVVLVFVNVGIAQKELLLTQGRSVFLALAPVDPRSLIQGDYMALDYAVTQRLDGCNLPRHGQLLLNVDARSIVQSARVAPAGAQPTPNEVMLPYHTASCRVQVGSDSFFFQEGQAQLYAQARYAEIKIANGESILVGLRGPTLEPLGARKN